MEKTSHDFAQFITQQSVARPAGNTGGRNAISVEFDVIFHYFVELIRP
jgi:hypothetical protein